MAKEDSVSEQQYEAIVQNLPDIVYKIDPQGKFTFINNAVRMLGYEPAELIGHHFKEILHPEDYLRFSLEGISQNGQALQAQRVVQLFDERRTQQRQSTQIEVRLIPRAWNQHTSPLVIGSLTALAEISAQGQYLEQAETNRFMGTVGIIRNITHQKRSQALIKRLYEVVDQSPVSIIITNAAGQIEYVNPHCLGLTGYRLTEVLGGDIDQLQTKKIVPGPQRGFLAIIREGAPWKGEALSCRKNGESFWESVLVKPLVEPEGHVTHYVIIKLDINEIKEAQEVLKTINDELDKRVIARTRELEESNKALQQEIEERKKAEQEQKRLEAQLLHSQKMETVGTMAGGIAHDFNNILTPILGLANVALLEIGEGRKGYAEVKEIHSAAVHARQLVQQILTFASVVEPKRIPTDLNAILEEVLALIKVSLPSTIEVHTQLPPAPSQILADPSQIHQVLVNLCTNAAYAMKEGYGTMRLSLSTCTLDKPRIIANVRLEAGSYVRLDVTDTGTGIPREILERIFDPFFTTKEKSQGTGLGLSVALGIIQGHGGRIAVESEVGRGTTFSIYLPEYRGKKPTTVKRRKKFQQGKGKILYVDDEPQVAHTIGRMLSVLGYEVTEMIDSRLAVGLFMENPAQFELVITDYTMPHLTGLELIKQIRSVRPGLPVILLTGYGEGILSPESQTLGIGAILMKPLSIQELGSVVRQVLETAATGKPQD